MKNRFTILDLIYFIGEKLSKPNEVSVHRLDGDTMLAVTFYNMLLGALVCVNKFYPLKGSPNLIVLILIIGLPYGMSWLVYHKLGRQNRVMAHYRGSAYDSTFVICLMLFVIILVPWLFPLFVII